MADDTKLFEAIRVATDFMEEKGGSAQVLATAIATACSAEFRVLEILKEGGWITGHWETAEITDVAFDAERNGHWVSVRSFVSKKKDEIRDPLERVSPIAVEHGLGFLLALYESIEQESS